MQAFFILETKNTEFRGIPLAGPAYDDAPLGAKAPSTPPITGCCLQIPGGGLCRRTPDRTTALLIC